MKTLKIFSTLFISAVLFTACEKENALDAKEISIDESVVEKKRTTTKKSSSIDNYDIHYFYDNSYHHLNEQEVQNYFTNSLGLPSNLVFESLEVELFTDDNGLDHYYLDASANSADTTYSITSSLKQVSGEPSSFLALAGSSCSCASSECNWGCEVTSPAGQGCTCSPCENKCKKTHTVTADFSPSMFQ